ncbi:MAG TPA: hypothetical protein VF986_02650 [Actinomycetota bacterium]
MKIRDLDQQLAGQLTPASPRRRRRAILLGAGALALVMASIGTAAALGGRSSPSAQSHQPSATVAAPGVVAAAPQLPEATTSTPAPVLANGTYPTYINKVDVKGATITVDVIQVFENGEAAINAAVEDGMTRAEAQYLYVYIRNQNPRLRTLAVAPHVDIKFADGCEAPPVRDKALTELAKRTATSDQVNGLPLYYYDITVANGAIQQIQQRLAQAAC